MQEGLRLAVFYSVLMVGSRKAGAFGVKDCRTALINHAYYQRAPGQALRRVWFMSIPPPTGSSRAQTPACSNHWAVCVPQAAGTERLMWETTTEHCGAQFFAKTTWTSGAFLTCCLKGFGHLSARGSSKRQFETGIYDAVYPKSTCQAKKHICVPTEECCVIKWHCVGEET